MIRTPHRFLHRAMAGLGLFALAGSMSAVTAAPPIAAAVAPAPVTAEPAQPRFEPTAEEAPANAAEILSEIGGGLASWYGSELAGRRTASGERFDPAEYTAAHRSLPFGSKVRVTAVGTGRSVVVRINDRGPFSRARVIDVSQAAARDLGLVATGSGQVQLQLVAS